MKTKTKLKLKNISKTVCCQSALVMLLVCYADVSTPTTEASASTTSTPTAAAGPPPSKKSRRSLDSEPEWFQQFVAEQRDVNAELIRTNHEMLKIAEERNNILKNLAEALVKKLIITNSLKTVANWWFANDFVTFAYVYCFAIIIIIIIYYSG